MRLKDWLKSWKDESVFEAPLKKPTKPLRSPYSHHGFMVSSMNPESVFDARKSFNTIWNTTHHKSGMPAPISEICTTFNDHRSFAIFPCGGNQLGLTAIGEQTVHDLFEQILLDEYPDLQWIRFKYDHESASVLGCQGAHDVETT